MHKAKVKIRGRKQQGPNTNSTYFCVRQKNIAPKKTPRGNVFHQNLFQHGPLLYDKDRLVNHMQGFLGHASQIQSLLEGAQAI